MDPSKVSVADNQPTVVQCLPASRRYFNRSLQIINKSVQLIKLTVCARFLTIFSSASWVEGDGSAGFCIVYLSLCLIVLFIV